MVTLMRGRPYVAFFGLVMLVAAGCKGSNEPTAVSVPTQPTIPARPTIPVLEGTVYSFDLTEGQQEWTAGAGAEDETGTLETLYKPLPAALDATSAALYVSGNRVALVFAKRKVTGLDPTVTYAATFATVIASQMGTKGCIRLGGPLGSNLGAFTQEPVSWSTIPATTESLGGAVLVRTGILTSGPCVGTWEYKLLVTDTGALRVRPAADGALWLYFGVPLDEGVGNAEFYLVSFAAGFKAVE
jgi:hypothetical protein